MERKLKFTVPNSYNGKKVNVFLRSVPKISCSLIKQMKKHNGAIRVNGETARTDRILSCGDEIEVTVGFDDEKSDIMPTDIPLNIVYEDEDIIVIDKPANMPTHVSQNHHNDTLSNALCGYYAKTGQNFVFRCVNRLDKGTSGLCAVAKHAYAQEILKTQLHTDDFVREYTALACGIIEHGGKIEQPIARCADSVIKRCVAQGGDYACTYYDILGHYSGNTLLKLRLKTGRTHQIRVHLAHIGHPLFGDFLYGSENELITRPTLHSSYISLIHPVTHEIMRFNSELPDDIRNLCK